jgi:hypothetical protein
LITNIKEFKKIIIKMPKLYKEIYKKNSIEKTKRKKKCIEGKKEGGKFE